MNPSPQPDRPSSPRGIWILIFAFVVLAIASAAALWVASEKYKSAARLIEFQTIQIESLQTAVETESLISTESLRQLRSVAAGRSLSAHAHMRLEDAARPDEVINTFWSDELSAGFIVLPESLAASAGLALEILLVNPEAEDAIVADLLESKSDRIIGFSQPANSAPPASLVLRITGLKNNRLPREFEADWER